MKETYHNHFYRPLNPPILGDFQALIPPKFGGLGGQNIPKISNARFLKKQFSQKSCGEFGLG
jgi:hypothetical protein